MSGNPPADTRFHEAQPLRPPRFGWLVAFPPALVTALAVAQRWIGRPLGPNSLSNAEYASLGLLLWVVYVWLTRVQLVTDLDATALSIRMRGLFRHDRIPLQKVKEASIVSIDASRFGGHGMRKVPGGRAYLARAGRGVRLELDGGGFVVIGSTRPMDLLNALGPLLKRARFSHSSLPLDVSVG